MSGAGRTDQLLQHVLVPKVLPKSSILTGTTQWDLKADLSNIRYIDAESVNVINARVLNAEFGEEDGTLFIGLGANQGANEGQVPNTNMVGTTGVGVRVANIGCNVTNNAFLGYEVGSQATNIDSSVFIGMRAGNYMCNVSGSVYIGAFAGSNIASAARKDFNLAMGFSVARTATGSDNVYLGAFSAVSNVGSSNVFVGYQAGQTLSSTTGELVITNTSNLNQTLIHAKFAGNSTDGQGHVSINKFPLSTYNLDVSGSTNITGLLNAGGNLQVAGNTLLNGNLDVLGQTLLSGPFFAQNASILGNLGVSGNTSLTGNLGVSGNTSLAGNLGVSGSTVLSNTSILGNLGVSGNTLLAGNLGVAGNTTLSGTLSVASNASFLGGVGVSGNLSVAGNTSLASLGVSGAAIFTGNTTLGGTVNVLGTLSAASISTSAPADFSNDITLHNNRRLIACNTGDVTRIAQIGGDAPWYLSNNGYFGINCNAPTAHLDVSGMTQTKGLHVTAGTIMEGGFLANSDSVVDGSFGVYGNIAATGSIQNSQNTFNTIGGIFISNENIYGNPTALSYLGGVTASGGNINAFAVRAAAGVYTQRYEYTTNGSGLAPYGFDLTDGVWHISAYSRDTGAWNYGTAMITLGQRRHNSANGTNPSFNWSSPAHLDIHGDPNNRIRVNFTLVGNFPV